MIFWSMVRLGRRYEEVGLRYPMAVLFGLVTGLWTHPISSWVHIED